MFSSSLQDRDMTHRQSPCGDSTVGVGDGGKEVEGCVDQLMGLGECETVYSSSAFEQWDTYWEDLTRYCPSHSREQDISYVFLQIWPKQTLGPKDERIRFWWSKVKAAVTSQNIFLAISQGLRR